MEVKIAYQNQRTGCFMNLSDLFLGTNGNIIAASSTIIMLFLMFMMSLRLYLSRRKKAYFSLTISLMIIMIQSGFIIAVEIWNRNAGIEADYIARVLQVISFILINMGIFQLYNRSNRKEFFYFYLFIITALIITFFRYSGLQGIENPSREMLLFHSIWLEFYLFLLIFLCLYLVSPFIGQGLKYRLGLVVYFIAHLSYVINMYVYDYNKPLLETLEHFLPILFYAIIFLFIFDRVVELLQAVHHSAITDGFTGLYNRRYFMNRMNEFIKRKTKLSVIFSDIDNFKELNDTQGHQKGDEVLKQVAKIMIEESEDIGIAGRYGGEELVILVTESSVNMRDFTENLRKRIELEAHVTVSVGFSMYKPGLSAEELVKQADQAMYYAKKSGKNRVHRFQEQY
jgi:diguanylate cyclase (GGDEF)-like protein